MKRLTKRKIFTGHENVKREMKWNFKYTFKDFFHEIQKKIKKNGYGGYILVFQ